MQGMQQETNQRPSFLELTCVGEMGTQTLTAMWQYQGVWMAMEKAKQSDEPCEVQHLRESHIKTKDCNKERVSQPRRQVWEKRCRQRKRQEQRLRALLFSEIPTSWPLQGLCQFTLPSNIRECLFPYISSASHWSVFPSFSIENNYHCFPQELWIDGLKRERMVEGEEMKFRSVLPVPCALLLSLQLLPFSLIATFWERR